MIRHVLLLLVACACARTGGDDAETRSPAFDPPVPAPSPSSETAAPPSETGSPPSTAETGTVPPSPPRLFAFVGGGDDRIRVYAMDPQTGALAFASDTDGGTAPSFLAPSPDRRRLYAANEGSDEISAFSVDAATGALSFLNRVPSNGSGPAHVAVDATGTRVLAANYGGGSVTMIAVGADGSLGGALATLATGANAHQVVVDPGNAAAFVPNLGSDTVSQLDLDVAAGTLVAGPSLALADGAGPRHLALHPSAPFAYLIDETDDTMVALRVDGGRLSVLQTISTLADGVDGADNYCAEVAVRPDGRFVYGSNRGQDTIAVFAVDPVTGLLARVGETSTGGSWPRHFSIDPTGSWLVVGNQRSDTIVSFRIDPASGTLTEGPSVSSPGPAFVGIVDLPPP